MPNAPRQNSSGSHTGDGPDERDRSTVRALLRALDLLELLSGQRDGLRLVDLAAQAEMPVSTAHRLLATLEERRFVHLDKQSKCWNVGSQCLSVGAAFGRRRNFAGAANPVMQRLRDRSGQTVNLALAESRRLTLVSQSPGLKPPVGLARLGSQSDIAATALGQSIIAALPQRQITSIVEETEGDARLERGARAALSETIRQTQARHYALDDEVNVAGLRCIAAPIFDEYGVPIGAISVVGAARGQGFLEVNDIGDIVMRAAFEVTGAIGGHFPRPASGAAYLA
jgi:IclR family acetate operon transcriptional repressor